MRAENTAKQRFAGRRPPDISLILDPALDVSAQHLFFRENSTMGKQAIGVVGLAVMGRNLALNIESRGHAVSVYNRSRAKTDELIAGFRDPRGAGGGGGPAQRSRDPAGGPAWPLRSRRADPHRNRREGARRRAVRRVHG